MRSGSRAPRSKSSLLRVRSARRSLVDRFEHHHPRAIQRVHERDPRFRQAWWNVHTTGPQMKSWLVAATAVLLVSPLLALDGQPGLHDPSTVVVHDGKFYVYATGNGLPISVSDDGWTWRRVGTMMQALPGG